MNMVRHDNKCVQLVVALAAIMLQGIDEHFGVCMDLKQPATVVGRAGYEVCSWSVRARRNRHGEILKRTSDAERGANICGGPLVPQRLKPVARLGFYGTGEPVPLTKPVFS